MELRRRDFLRTGLLTAGSLAFGPAFWRQALAATPVQPGSGPYGPLQAPDVNGLRLPSGFSSRVVAQGLAPVQGTSYPWHIFSDGAATYATPDGGWILVSNSEAPAGSGGGASAIRFRADGSMADAYRILGNTNNNCAGGATPSGMWLSCEEVDDGRVWECDPSGARAAVVHPAMGVFSHEAVAVDPVGKRVYLTEDEGDSGLYRYTPVAYPDLSKGLLEIAVVGEAGVVQWKQVPDPLAQSAPTRKQVPGSTVFRRGEGIWFDSGIVYIATTSDDRIYAYNTGTEMIDVLYDGKTTRDAPLHQVDNVTVSRSGDLFVCEDADDLDMGIITPEREVARFLTMTGPQHGESGTAAASELTGVVFDPAGRRLYFASQRGFGVGLIYEITGPFRRDRPREITPPGLRVEAPPTLPAAKLRRSGLPIGIRLGRAARVSVTLRVQTAARPRRTGPNPLPPRGRRSVALASKQLPALPLGPTRVVLPLHSGGRTFLSRRRRNFLAQLSVTATDAAGNRSVATRKVVVTLPTRPSS